MLYCIKTARQRIGKRRGTMNYKVLLVDVDGTLMSHARKTIAPAVVEGLKGLQRRGIPVVIATGRGAYAVREAVMGGLRADYIICTNGAYIADGGGRVLWDRPMSQDQFEAICALGRRGSSIGFSFADGYYCYYDEPAFSAFFRSISGDMDALRAGCQRHLRGMPYAGFGLVERAEVERFHAERGDMRMTGYAGNAYDINQIECNKATGTSKLLSLLGLAWQEAVFIGDGENDLELLSAAGLGVAMGNAPDHVKAAADVVTGDVLTDGVLQAISKIF